MEKLTSAHWLDEAGNPAGGNAYGPGFAIGWQNGPLGRGVYRIPQNGAFVETVIEACADRLEFYQENELSCTENADALESLRVALSHLAMRTKRREAAGTEGTHEGS